MIKAKEMAPYELAMKFEQQIKEAITQRFSVNDNDMSILDKDEDGIYWSQEEPNTLCCLVVGEKNGHLYLVAAKASKGGNKLSNYKCDIIS